MNNGEKRIALIKEERLQLLKDVKESILKNKDNVHDLLNDILSVLDYDQQNIKKLVALKNSKELIASLVDDIVNAKSNEEIAQIRKRLNYYISKVKEELQKRNLGPMTMISYQEKISNMRKDITQYVRYLRRDVNLLEIDKLYHNYEKLSQEEMKRFKYLLKLEQQYNHRHLNNNDKVVVSSDNSEVKKEVEPKKEDIKEVEAKSEDNKLLESLKENLEKSQQNMNLEKISIPEKKSIPIDGVEITSSPKKPAILPPSITCLEYGDVKDFLEDRISAFNDRYKIIDTIDYDGNKKSNFIKFLKNVPKFLKNKRAIKKMEKECCYLIRNNDLISYIEYLRERNSIKQSLDYIFHDSELYSSSRRYINRHEQCSKWLFEFCKYNHLNLPLTMEKVK